MKPQELEGDKIGDIELVKLISQEEKTIDGGRGSYLTYRFLGQTSSQTPVWVTLFPKNKYLITNWRSFLPGYDANDRLERRMKDYKFLSADFLSSFFPNNPIIPHVYAVGEDTIKITISRNNGESWETQDREFIYLATEPQENIPIPLNQDQAVDITKKLACGLQELHDRGIYHRRIHPLNIVGKIKAPKLSNFDEASRGLGYTVMTVLDGDKNFYLELFCMCPERIDVEAYLSPMSEVYSLAVTLNYLKEGLPNKPERTTDIIISKHKENRYPILKWSSGTNKNLIEVVNQATEKNPKHRYQSMAEFARALEKI